MIHLSSVNVTPTIRCNLRCRLCGILVPQYEYRPHMSVDEFRAHLHAVFEIVDFVDKLQITGGEPLMHAELHAMLEECFNHAKQFGKLWLFTNCAAPMQQKLLDIFRRHKDRVIIYCSDYGVKPDTARGLVNALSEYGIDHKYIKYHGDDQYCDGWVDQGDFVKHDRPESELREVFAKCPHVGRGGSWYVRGGQMHWCGRSIRGTELRKVPLRSDDYLDIFGGTAEERKARLEKLMNAESILACDYCNGYYGTNDAGKRHPAGEQL